MHISAENRNWFIGVVLAILANIISNLGLNFQKKAHSRRQAQKQALNNKKTSYERPITHPQANNIDGHKSSPTASNSKEDASSAQQQSNKKQGSYVCDGVWLVGLCGQVLGALLDFVALGYAPQSVVAPLGSLTLVVNVIVSVPMHNEIPSMRTILGTLCIICGAVTTVASSPREDSVESVSGVFDLYEHTSFLIYASITGGLISIGWCLTQYFVYLSRNKQARYTVKYYKQHRFVIAAISGTMGAQNVLFAKSVSVLVVQSIENGGRLLFGYWETYLLLAGLVSTIYFQLRWLNSGLKRFSALYVAPIFQAFWITVSVMGGLIVYKEYEHMKLWQRIVFPIGVIVTIGGVFYLTTQANVATKKYDKIKEELSEEEEQEERTDIDEDNVEDPILLSVDEEEDIYDINSIKLHSIHQTHERHPSGLMGLIDASIVTGSSLGKMLVDPHALYKDIHLGANEEDAHFKEILSPNLSRASTASLLIGDDGDKRKYKQRSASLGHFSDNNNERRRRIKGKGQRERARSHSPVLRVEDMAPHEVVWEKLTSIFVERELQVAVDQHSPRYSYLPVNQAQIN
eukprot:241443_1